MEKCTMQYISYTLLSSIKDIKLRRKMSNFRRRKEIEHPEWMKGLKAYEQHEQFWPFNLPEPLERRKAA
jgi:hypothetical protein